MYALAVSGSNVYAGGAFTTAGGSPATNIAQWNGNSWSALGSGLAGGLQGTSVGVYALAISGSTLYAGGNFSTTGPTRPLTPPNGTDQLTALGSE